ncbi:MAG: hypothetical protein HY718_08910 [Planctomycetes bacterium]|nr:hypothetical protein [Planctomycetota bacterium]
MPFEQRTVDNPHPELIEQIERVLRQRNRQPQSSDEPRVIWEENRYLGRVHVTVIWGRWEKVQPEARGRVILDAIERAMGQQEASRIGLALGVTPEQAERLGVG